MDEYISREAAIKELRKVYEDEYPTASGDFDEYASHDVPNVLRNMKAADVQPVNQWISIDERLPQDGEEALVYAGNRGVMIGLYDSVLQVWLDYECCGLKVTHWQPLPEPPKKEG